MSVKAANAEQWVIPEALRQVGAWSASRFLHLIPKTRALWLEFDEDEPSKALDWCASCEFCFAKVTNLKVKEKETIWQYKTIVATTE